MYCKTHGNDGIDLIGLLLPDKYSPLFFVAFNEQDCQIPEVEGNIRESYPN